MTGNKILFLLVLLVCAGMLLCSCAEPEEFNEAGFMAVTAYADDILPEISIAITDFRGWLRDPHNKDRIEWLKERREALTSVNNRHLNDQFPTHSEMRSWTVMIERDDEEWLVRGRELANAVRDIQEIAGEMIDTIEEMFELCELDEIPQREMDRIRSVKEKADQASREMRRIFYNQ